MDKQIPLEAQAIIYEILRRGNTVEIKKTNGQVVIVEIKRQVKKRLVTTG